MVNSAVCYILCKYNFRQRFKTFFLGYCSACTAFWSVGTVYIFYFRKLFSIFYLCFKLIGQLALFFNKTYNLLLSFFNISKIRQPVAHTS